MNQREPFQGNTIAEQRRNARTCGRNLAVPVGNLNDMRDKNDTAPRWSTDCAPFAIPTAMPEPTSPTPMHCSVAEETIHAKEAYACSAVRNDVPAQHLESPR